MKPRVLLRIAAVIMLLHTIGHTFGALSWKQAPDKATGLVITAMQANHFEFMGRRTSLAIFYEGYGILLIFVLLLVSILLWLLASEAGNPLTVKLLIPLTAFLLLFAVAEYIYFFPFAAFFSGLAGIAALVSLIQTRHTQHR